MIFFLNQEITPDELQRVIAELRANNRGIGAPIERKLLASASCDFRFDIPTRNRRDQETVVVALYEHLFNFEALKSRNGRSVVVTWEA